MQFSLVITVVGTISSHPDNFILNCNVALMEFWYLISLFVSKMREEKEGRKRYKKTAQEKYGRILSFLCVLIIEVCSEFGIYKELRAWSVRKTSTYTNPLLKHHAGKSVIPGMYYPAMGTNTSTSRSPFLCSQLRMQPAKKRPMSLGQLKDLTFSINSSHIFSIHKEILQSTTI